MEDTGIKLTPHNFGSVLAAEIRARYNSVHMMAVNDQPSDAVELALLMQTPMEMYLCMLYARMWVGAQGGLRWNIKTGEWE